MKTKTNTKTKENKSTYTDYKRLNTLKREILSAHEECEAHVAAGKKAQQMGLTAGILTGKKLAEVREILPYGRFDKWCKKELPKMCRRTIYNYLSLVNGFGNKVQHGALQSATGLRKAYIALGMIDDVASQPAPVTTIEPKTGETGATFSETKTEPDKVQMPDNPAHKIAALVSRNVMPSITKADVLSRVRFLMGQLLIDINNKMQSGLAKLPELEAATLMPLQEWFEKQKRAK